MAKRKKTEKELALSALRDKLKNLKLKQAKCIAPEGIARYAKMIHETGRLIAAKGGN